LSKNRSRNTKKGRGYSSKSSPVRQNQRNLRPIILTLSAVALAIALGIYWYTRGTDAPTGQEQVTASGLKYIDEVVGEGESPSPGKTVVVHYTGKLENGTKFDSSLDRGQPFSFPIGMGEVIEGWDEGVMTMKVGGKRRLIIPPHLGYGSQDKGTIPPNSTLIFDVELLRVK
jgi:FKBP-type peptidyl-prolyl cis-trans isomerase